MADGAGSKLPDSRASEICRRMETMRADRGVLDQHLQEIAELVAPMRADFTVQRAMGEKRGEKIYDGTAGMAADNLAAGLYGNISSPSNNWFEIEHEDEDINDDAEVKEWLSVTAKRMRNSFAANGGRFYSRVFDLYADLVTFGTGIFWQEEIKEKAQVYNSVRHLAECYIAENGIEQIDTVYRRFQFSVRQARDYFNAPEDRLPEKIVKAGDKKLDDKFDFIHAVYPNPDYRQGLIGPKGKKFTSCWVMVDGKHLIREKGFDRFGYATPRWSTRSRSAYGDSQAMLALADIKMLNTMSKTGIVGAQMVVRPPTLAADECARPGMKFNPGAMIYGGLDEAGNPRYRPYISGAQPNLSIELEQARREMIREAFHATLMMMVSQPNQTATEWLGKQDEKLRLLGPRLGNIQSEFLDPVIDWRFATMLSRGAFPPPPDILRQQPGIRVRYVSPLARAQKVGEAAAISRAWQAIMPLAEDDPSVLDVIDRDDAARKIWDGYGAASSSLRDPKQVAEMRQQRAQVEQQQMQQATALPASQAAKNMAQAREALQAAA